MQVNLIIKVYKINYIKQFLLIIFANFLKETHKSLL